MRKRKLIFFALLLACDSPTSVEPGWNVQTGSNSYSVQATTIGRSVIVDLRFTNSLPIPVEWGHCGGRPAALYRKAGSAWMLVGHGPGTLDCGQPGEIIGPGESYGITIQFHGPEISRDGVFHFATDDLTGTYRIILGEVVVDRNDANPIGVLIHEKHRVSNSFEVVE